MTEPECCCGTCRWFHRYNAANKVGDCEWMRETPTPPPMWVKTEVQTVFIGDGTDCPAWKPTCMES